MTEHAKLYAPTDCGKDGYPPEWHEHVKDWIREAAGHRCVRCSHPFLVGRSSAAWSPCDGYCTHDGPTRIADDGATEASWRVLTVHHLNGVKHDCRWWNLAALCQRCHLQIQGKVVMDRRWPHEHSHWFRAYAAAFYAWTYLGEDLTREETEARMPELLELEARQLTLGCG